MGRERPLLQVCWAGSYTHPLQSFRSHTAPCVVWQKPIATTRWQDTVTTLRIAWTLANILRGFYAYRSTLCKRGVRHARRHLVIAACAAGSSTFTYLVVPLFNKRRTYPSNPDCHLPTISTRFVCQHDRVRELTEQMLDNWQADIVELNEKSGGHAMVALCRGVLERHGCACSIHH